MTFSSIISLIALIFLPTLVHSSPSPSSPAPSITPHSDEALLWQLSSDENISIASPAITQLRALLRKSSASRSESDRLRFEKIMTQVTKRIQGLLQLADGAVERKEYSEASDIMRHILDASHQILDKNSLNVCHNKLAQSLFREALVGNVTWEALSWHYGNWSLSGELSPSDQFTFDMALANVKNLQQSKSERDGATRPYVLRFHLPQHCQTPSLAHFGHAMLDGLWPFVLAYSAGKFSRSQHGAAPIFVLDIGLYLIPLLHTVFPIIRFVPFHSTETLPPNCEPVDLIGIGMASFSSLSLPPSPLTGQSPFFDKILSQFHPSSSPPSPSLPSLSVIREIIFQQLGFNSSEQPQCIVLLSRNAPPEHIAAFHARQRLDASRESADLKQFHDLGPAVYTALHYLPSTAQERRGIESETQLFQQLVKVFQKKFGICVKHVELSHLSLREQFQVFASAKVVIGQHGAGLAFTPFMPSYPSDPGIVLELLPMINPTFHLACEAMGVRHLFLDRVSDPELYSSANNTFLSLNAKLLVRRIAKELEGWKAPFLGKAHNLTAPSSVASSSFSSDSPSPAQTCPVPSPTLLSQLSQLPEFGYVHSTILRNEVPFLWKDSLHSEPQQRWLNLSFHDWETIMHRKVYSKGLNMPQKIMASPSGVFDFYDTFLFDVINLSPGDAPPAIPVNQQSLDNYLSQHSSSNNSDGSFPLHTLRYVHLRNRTVVDIETFGSPTADMIPQHRQVQGPAEFPALGFQFLDRSHPSQLRETQPIIAKGESYYLRISGEKGDTFYDAFAPSLLPAAFNHFLRPSLLSDSIPPTPRASPVTRLSLYFSEKSAVTSLHYDTSGKGSVLCQLSGSKRIQLWSPETEEAITKPYQPASHHLHRRSQLNGRAPQRESVSLLERREMSLLLRPGWCVYFPVGWWHHVESLEEENISTRFTVT